MADGGGKTVQVKANDKPTPRAFQEIRDPAPLVSYASSEDSFDTPDSSNEKGTFSYRVTNVMLRENS